VPIPQDSTLGLNCQTKGIYSSNPRKTAKGFTLFIKKQKTTDFRTLYVKQYRVETQSKKQKRALIKQPRSITKFIFLE
jgi:hypothetical protein